MWKVIIMKLLLKWNLVYILKTNGCWKQFSSNFYFIDTCWAKYMRKWEQLLVLYFFFSFPPINFDISFVLEELSWLILLAVFDMFTRWTPFVILLYVSHLSEPIPQHFLFICPFILQSLLCAYTGGKEILVKNVFFFNELLCFSGHLTVAACQKDRLAAAWSSSVKKTKVGSRCLGSYHSYL